MKQRTLAIDLKSPLSLLLPSPQFFSRVPTVPSVAVGCSIPGNLQQVDCRENGMEALPRASSTERLWPWYSCSTGAKGCTSSAPGARTYRWRNFEISVLQKKKKKYFELKGPRYIGSIGTWSRARIKFEISKLELMRVYCIVKIFNGCSIFTIDKLRSQWYLPIAGLFVIFREATNLRQYLCCLKIVINSISAA